MSEKRKSKHSYTGIEPNQEYVALRNIVRENGFFAKLPERVIAELILLCFLHFGATLIYFTFSNVIISGIAFFIMVYGGLGITTNTHTSSHGATSNNQALNKFLTYFGYPFILGMGTTFWKWKHCIVHHQNPNVHQHDGDADLLPFFVLNKEDYDNMTGIKKYYYKYQGLFFPILLGMSVFNLQRHGWIYVISALRSKKNKGRYWLEVSVLLSHYVFWIGLPCLFLPFSDVIIFYILRNIVMGYGMFAMFAPAHYPAEALFLEEKISSKNFILSQTFTTVNFRTGYLGRLLCAGVEYQIEHHLFPEISHQHYPAMSKIIRNYCLKHNYPYQTIGWGTAIWKSYMTLYKPKALFNLDDLL